MTLEQLDINLRDVIATYKLLGHEKETEIRGFNPHNKNDVLVRFVHSQEEFVKVVSEYNGKYNLNAGINERKQNGTTSEDVITVNKLVLDLDPNREKGTASTMEELEKAEAVADKIIEWYGMKGLKKPLKALSGNGYHLWCFVSNLEISSYNRKQIESQIKQFYDDVIEKFSTNDVKIDKVGDLARVIKIIGTKSIKGIETSQRPHRVSKFLSIPERNEDMKLTHLILNYEYEKKEKKETNTIDNKLILRLDQIRKKDSDLDKYLNGELLKKISRSEVDMTVICKLLSHAFEKSEIETIALNHLPKWKEQGEQYRKLTWEKAQDFVNEKETYAVKQWRQVAEKIRSENDFITIRENDDIYKFNGRYYEPDGETNIKELAHELIYNCNTKAGNEIVNWIRRDKTYIRMKELYNNNIINCENGVLDPETFEKLPHSSKYYSLSVLPITINPKARNLKLWNHILSIIDPKDINLILELLWIVISWNNPFKKMFIFKGETNSQKSTLADMIAMIIGEQNIARQPPKSFLAKDARFGSSHFIGKRMNIATEIGDLTEEHLERQKSYVGAEKQNTERKGDNAEYIFDPTKFVFLYTTNKLGSLYHGMEDNSVITRYQFLIFRNVLSEEQRSKDTWSINTFFKDENEKQECISTILNIVLNYKKTQKQGKIPKTRFSTVEETKKILKETQPLEDKYFDDNRLIKKAGSRLTLDEIQTNFERFVGYTLKTPAEMGHILKKNGYISRQSNSKTVYDGVAFGNVVAVAALTIFGK